MIVAELIAALEEHDQDAEVVVSGTGCYTGIDYVENPDQAATYFAVDFKPNTVGAGIVAEDDESKRRAALDRPTVELFRGERLSLVNIDEDDPIRIEEPSVKDALEALIDRALYDDEVSMDEFEAMTKALDAFEG